MPAPKLAAPNQAMAKLPPDVNPAAPERQFNKSLLKLCLFTRKLMIFFPPNWLYFRDGKLLLCHKGEEIKRRGT